MVLSTEWLYQEFADRLRRFIQKRVADPQSAEDILQEVFLRIHNRIDSLRSGERVQSWVYQIARNAIIDHYRSLRPASEIPEALASDPEEEEEDALRELAPAIREFLHCLPEEYRLPLILTEYLGKTQQQVADQLGLSLSGAKSRVQRGREKLKSLLLDCCHFELDQGGRVIDYFPRQDCCANRRC